MKKRVNNSSPIQSPIDHRLKYSKKDLVLSLSESLQISKDHTSILIDKFLNEIQHRVSAQASVQIHGFGTFKTSVRKARRGRNPHTGEEMYIPSKQVIKFIPSSRFKDKVNN